MPCFPAFLLCTSCTILIIIISGHSSAAGRAQDRECLPARDRCSAAEPVHTLCMFAVNVVLTDSPSLPRSTDATILGSQPHFNSLSLGQHQDSVTLC